MNKSHQSQEDKDYCGDCEWSHPQYPTPCPCKCHSTPTPTDWEARYLEELHDGGKYEAKCGGAKCRWYIEKPCVAVKSLIRTLIQQAKEEESERCFDVLMSCMPKSAENIATITQEDARIMLQKFVQEYWNPLTQRKE